MENNSEYKHKNLHASIEDIKAELMHYVNRRVRLFRLDAYEKLSISASILGYGLIVLLVVAIILFFILLGLAFFIGELLNSQAAGFSIMAGLSLLVLLIVYLMRSKIKRGIVNMTIKFIRKVETDDDDER